MSKHESLYNDYTSALERLKEALETERTEMTRDSAVLRFIMTFEAAWKLLQVRLSEEHAVDCRSPKSCIREAFQQGILPDDPHWLEIADKRNRLTHIYSELEAKEIYEELPEPDTSYKLHFAYPPCIEFPRDSCIGSGRSQISNFQCLMSSCFA